MIKAKPYERRERILKLLREAMTAENLKETEKAREKLMEALELAEVYEPEFYFEICFRMANVLLEEENYLLAVEYAVRGIYRAPSRELYRLGIVRFGEILRAIKAVGKLSEIKEKLMEQLAEIEDDEELHTFLSELIKVIDGKRAEGRFSVKEFSAVLESLQGRG